MNIFTTSLKSQLLLVLLFLTAASMLSDEAKATGWRTKLTDPVLEGNGITPCPKNPNSILFPNWDCLFIFGAHSVATETVLCGRFKDFDDPGCVTPGHESTDIHLLSSGLLHCRPKGSCKVLLQLYTLEELALAVETLNNNSLVVPTFTDPDPIDPDDNTCPFLSIRGQVVDASGLVCSGGISTVDGQLVCNGNLGSYYNARIPFDPMFGPLVPDILCLHGDFRETAGPFCKDTDGSDGFNCYDFVPFENTIDPS